MSLVCSSLQSILAYSVAHYSLSFLFCIFILSSIKSLFWKAFCFLSLHFKADFLFWRRRLSFFETLLLLICCSIFWSFVSVLVLEPSESMEDIDWQSSLSMTPLERSTDALDYGTFFAWFWATKSESCFAGIAYLSVICGILEGELLPLESMSIRIWVNPAWPFYFGNGDSSFELDVCSDVIF